MVSLTIDGRHVEVPHDATILDAAREVGASIPTLCYLKGVNEVGACRVCVVEVEGATQLVAACNTRVSEGMSVLTDSPRVRLARHDAVELILSRHDASCTTCVRNGTCQLQRLTQELGIVNPNLKSRPDRAPWPIDAALIRDEGKCIQCLRCVSICDRVQGMGVWQLRGSGGISTVGLAEASDPRETACTYCGQCIVNCPTGALHERDDTTRVLRALADPDTVVIAQMAPAVRVSWAETLGIPREKATASLLVGALKKIGVDHVFDTTLAADFTIMEEGAELIGRLERGETEDLPMFTSCCAGWYRFVMSEYPELVGQLSTAKSPQQMLGALLRTYFARKLGVDPAKVFNVSIMPCTAKKFEAEVEALDHEDGRPDIDAVLTTREVVRLLGSYAVDAERIEAASFDSPLGAESGSGVIFGLTAGVMESALRTAYCILNGEKPQPNVFRYSLAEQGCWREGSFNLGGRQVRIAVVHGLKNARELVEAVLAGTVHYDFVEVMACPGGCVGGGGQPIAQGESPVGERHEELSELDIMSPMRFSHENPVVARCYEEFLGKPLSPLAQELLHVKGVHHA